jgi:hypothetical protein
MGGIYKEKCFMRNQLIIDDITLNVGEISAPSYNFDFNDSAKCSWNDISIEISPVIFETILKGLKDNKDIILKRGDDFYRATISSYKITEGELVVNPVLCGLIL